MFIVIVGLSIMLYLSIKRNLEYMALFEDVFESYRELLEQLNYYYDKFDKKSKLELFLDEPVTRELVEDIKGTKKAIKFAAEKISVFIENENEES
jgi:hypothetical protein